MSIWAKLVITASSQAVDWDCGGLTSTLPCVVLMPIVVGVDPAVVTMPIVMARVIPVVMVVDITMSFGYWCK